MFHGTTDMDLAAAIQNLEQQQSTRLYVLAATDTSNARCNSGNKRWSRDDLQCFSGCLRHRSQIAIRPATPLVPSRGCQAGNHKNRPPINIR
jgi:hypothetical protein